MRTLLLSLALLAAGAARGAAGAKPSYAINTPKDFLAAWSAGTPTEDTNINPCLVGTIMAPPSTTNGQPTTYPPGQDKTWVGGHKSLSRYLTLKKNLGQGNPLITAMALAVGFFPSYTWTSTANPMTMDTPAYSPGKWELIVFDGCQKKAGARDTPTVAYWLNRAIYTYGVAIPDATYRTLTTQYWNLANYTGCADVYCPESSGFFAGNITCGCDATYMAAVKALSPLAPGYDPALKKKQTTSTAACLEGLKGLGAAAGTPQAVRAALNYCFGASTWNTGNGLSWDGTGTDRKSVV